MFNNYETLVINDDRRSIKTYLGDKICILVTHQIQFLQDATRIIVLENVCVKIKWYHR